MWHVLVPVKGGERAKSRLDLDPGRRRRIAAAMASDTVAAVRACPVVAAVTVLCGPDAAAELVLPSGVDTVEEGVSSSAPDLNDLLRWAATRPGPARSVAVVVADLPALTSVTLADTLRSASGVSLGVVPDRHDVGTTVLTATRGAELRPRFGPRSAAAHVAEGAVPVIADPRVRCDVDVLEDLWEATALGVGPRTSAVLAADVH